MLNIGEFLISALFVPLLAGPAAVYAAEFEVLDRFSVDGYTVLRGSADIPGGSFAVGGATFVVKSGNIGIGTAAPGSKLEVNGNVRIWGDKPLRLGEGSNTYYYDMGREVSGGGFVIEGNQTGSVNYAFRKGGSDMLTIANNGNVGIGTASPGAKLHAYVLPAAYDTVDDILRLTSKFESVGNAASAAIGSGPAIVFSGGIGDNQTRDRARIAAVYEGGNVSGLAFHTQNTADIITEKVRIQNNGNVGIGTTAPVGRLSVRAAAGAGNVVVANFNNPYQYGSGSGTAAAVLRLNRTPNDAGSTGVMADISGGNEDETTSAAGYLAFGTRSGSPEATTERMRLTSGGNVGIGTVNPVTKFQVGAGITTASSDIVKINTGDAANTAALVLSNWDGAATAYGPRIVYDNSGRGTWYEGSSDGANNFDIGRTWGTPDLRINSAGNVGIGTTNPAAKLEVAGVIRSNSATPLNFTSIGSGTYNQTILYHDATNGHMLERARTTDSAGGTIIDWSISQRGGGTPALIVKGSGNVGVGTADPGAKLEVSGGYIKAGDWPAFYAYNNSGGDQTTTGIWPGNVVLFNNGGHYSVSTYKFTAPVAGWYQFSWTCYTNSKPGRAFLLKNNGAVMQTEDNGKSISLTLELAAGDYVNLSGGATTPLTWYGAIAHNAFTGHLIMSK